LEARSRWPSIINEKTFADFKRVAEQTGILTKEADHPPQECRCPRASSIFRDAKRPALTPERLTAIYRA
jgi:hypothetical protein